MLTAWRSRGLQGDALEALLEKTHDQYKKQGLGIVEKIPTPIKVTKIDQKRMHC